MDGENGRYRFELEFDTDAGLVRAVHFGHSTGDDLKRFVDALIADPRWRPGMNLITDFRGDDPSQLSGDDLRECVAHTIKYSAETAGTKVATIVDSPLAYGLSRIWEAQAEMQGSPTEVRIFDTVEAAERWLGVSGGRRRG